jgi:protein SSD1
MGMLPQQQQMANFQMQGQIPNISPHGNQYQFPQQQIPQPHLGVPLNAPTQPSAHRRNQSALPQMGSMGPPPAPTQSTSGANFSFCDFTFLLVKVARM